MYRIQGGDLIAIFKGKIKVVRHIYDKTLRKSEYKFDVNHADYIIMNATTEFYGGQFKISGELVKYCVPDFCIMNMGSWGVPKKTEATKDLLETYRGMSTHAKNIRYGFLWLKKRAVTYVSRNGRNTFRPLWETEQFSIMIPVEAIKGIETYRDDNGSPVGFYHYEIW